MKILLKLLLTIFFLYFTNASQDSRCFCSNTSSKLPGKYPTYLCGENVCYWYSSSDKYWLCKNDQAYKLKTCCKKRGVTPHCYKDYT